MPGTNSNSSICIWTQLLETLTLPSMHNHLKCSMHRPWCWTQTRLWRNNVTWVLNHKRYYTSDCSNPFPRQFWSSMICCPKTIASPCTFIDIFFLVIAILTERSLNSFVKAQFVCWGSVLASTRPYNKSICGILTVFCGYVELGWAQG